MRNIETNLAILIGKSLFDNFFSVIDELSKEEYRNLLDECYDTKEQDYRNFTLTLSKHTDDVICKITVKNLKDTVRFSMPNEVFEMWLDWVTKPNSIYFSFQKHHYN